MNQAVIIMAGCARLLQVLQPTTLQTAKKRRRFFAVRTRPYRTPAASPLRPFSLARHSHGATGALSAHRPRRAARASRSRNTTGQSTLRCPAQREITNAASECARKATCGAVRIRQGIISGMAAIKLTLTS